MRTRTQGMIPKRKSHRLSEHCYAVGSDQVYNFGAGVVVVLDTANGNDMCPIMQERFQDVQLEIAR
jgi:hypothetical protein